MPKLQLTKAALRELPTCWPSSQIEALLALWPSDPVPWSWYLGARLGGMTRRQADDRLRTARHLASKHRITLPLPRGKFERWMRNASMADYVNVLQLLAAYLDSEPATEQSAREALRLALKSPAGLSPADEDEVLPGGV
jgi:hypothetical protein